MRTTVNIDDELLVAAKARATAKGITLGQMIERAVRRELAVDAPTPGPPIPVFTGGTGPRPGLDLTSNRAVFEALDEGLDLDRLR
ncbi:MAG: antitoxin [Actinomycetota bacterium]|nr:antitoxin [Actinomycetota bacterium]